MENYNFEKVKYIHIMSFNSIVFNKQIIDMINDNKEFDSSEHLFIISNENIYNQNKNNSNVIFEKNISNNPKLFSNYAQKCDYIILHSYSFSFKMLFLSKKVLKKIIWIEWGHDLYDEKLKKVKLYKIPKRLIGNFMRYLVKKQKQNFYAIGIGPRYDIIQVKKIFGDKLKVMMTPYGYVKDNKVNVDKIRNFKNKNGFIKVMVGHCAYPFINHIDILKKLQKYKNENIKISLVLAYGDMDYAKTVKKEAIRIFGENKIEIIDKMMSRYEYIKYLASIDIAIMTYKHQSGMENIYNLLYFGKKLFLNKDGYLKLITLLDGIETYNYENIDNMDFNTFSKPVENPQKGIDTYKYYIDDKFLLNMWKNTFDELS